MVTVTVTPPIEEVAAAQKIALDKKDKEFWDGVVMWVATGVLLVIIGLMCAYGYSVYRRAKR
jgi:ABC-type glycerol-3-phosphate transport system permease component